MTNWTGSLPALKNSIWEELVKIGIFLGGSCKTDLIAWNAYIKSRCAVKIDLYTILIARKKTLFEVRRCLRRCLYYILLKSRLFRVSVWPTFVNSLQQFKCAKTITSCSFSGIYSRCSHIFWINKWMEVSLIYSLGYSLCSFNGKFVSIVGMIAWFQSS